MYAYLFVSVGDVDDIFYLELSCPVIFPFNIVTIWRILYENVTYFVRWIMERYRYNISIKDCLSHSCTIH